MKKLILISGPSATGKDTINDLLFQDKKFIKKNEISYSVSYTTRKKRKGETNSINYYFVSKDEFEKMIKKDYFTEYVKYGDNYYGTSKELIKNNLKTENIILKIDVIGGKKIMKLFKDQIISFFILPPSIHELKKRMLQRNFNTKGEIEKRIQTARKEIKEKNNYQYIIENNNINITVSKIKKILNTCL